MTGKVKGENNVFRFPLSVSAFSRNCHFEGTEKSQNMCYGNQCVYNDRK